jgi:hypothetical protein
MKKINYWFVFLSIILVLITLGFGFWYFQTKKQLNIFILDKTVTDFSYREHAPFVWVLKNRHILTPKKKLYSLSDDYYGFIPLRPAEKQKEKYKIRSIRLYDVLTMSDQLDMVYFTDNYGVFSNELNDTSVNLRPYLIYGGLNQNDYLLLREMKRKRKLILTEFNLLGSPTSDLIREKTEELFDFRWTGWTGRYFKSLKNIPKNQLPEWIISAYQKKYLKTWNFAYPGVVLINEDGNIVVLEENEGLKTALPTILNTPQAQNEYHLSPFQKYPFWFDIIQTSKKNQVQAWFNLDVSNQGEKELKSNGIPTTFPAIIEHSGDYNFYYFSGDFSDNTPTAWLSYFKGVPGIMNKIHTGSNGTSNEFFWNFYVPLLNGILDKHFYKK